MRASDIRQEVTDALAEGLVRDGAANEDIGNAAIGCGEQHRDSAARPLHRSAASKVDAGNRRHNRRSAVGRPFLDTQVEGVRMIIVHGQCLS
jgi:hypothetical protein